MMRDEWLNVHHLKVNAETIQIRTRNNEGVIDHFKGRLALPQAFICIKKTQLFDCIISIFHNVLIRLLSLAC